MDTHIEKRSLEVQAADAIRRRIISGDMPPGTRLTEVRLAEELDLSRGTVRGALARLVSEGLVEQIPYSGWSVISLTARDAWELYTLRSSLEALAARLAAANLKPSDGVSIKKAMDELIDAAKTGDMHAVADADFALHKKIIDVSGHARLKQQYMALEHQIRMYIASSDSLVMTLDEVVAQHAPLVEAILAKDAERASTIARQHNLVEGKTLVEHFKNSAKPEDEFDFKFGIND